MDKHIMKQVKQTLSQMTIREKVGQCVMIEPVFCLESLRKDGHKFDGLLDPKFLKLLFEDYKIGFLLYGGVTRIGDDYMSEWGHYINEVNKYVKTHEHLPILYGIDAIHGVNFVKETTIFSHNLGAVATWNPELIQQSMINVSKELDSIGINCNFAPTIDIARDQRWGRVYESLGEDPFLGSTISEALVQGLQHTGKVAACGKHFVGYGASNNGMDRTPVDISTRQLKELYLPPFEAAIQAGVKSIMVSGGDLNGVPIPASKYILTTVLRDELGFEGFTVSDWEDVFRLAERHNVVPNQEAAVLRAFNAGLDVNMAVSSLKTVDLMEQLVKDGNITMERLDQAVTRILRVKYELGLFSYDSINLDLLATRPHRIESKQLAQQLALESLTLLKNENDILPLSKDITSILVTGIGADSKRHLCGGWTLSWASADEDDLEFPTILDELKAALPNATIVYAPTKEDITALDISAETFDVCISVVTEEPHSEWLGDSFDLKFEQAEFDTLVAAHETGLPVVMVSVVGRPTEMKWVDANIPAILWAYLPGSEGAKPIVDVLFGNENPSGKLPISFPRDANQIPVVYNMKRYISGEILTSYNPLYAFGFGLSYTTFEYDNLIVPPYVRLGDDFVAQVRITNTGSRMGTEVIQLYLRDQYASVTRPIRELKAFAKVTLDPGETKDVILTVKNRDLKLYNEELEFVEEPRDCTVEVANLAIDFSIVE